MNLKISPKFKTVALVVVAALVFGAAGYMITPQRAKSAMSQIDKSLQDTQNQLKVALEAQKKLGEELDQTTQSLAAAQTQVEELTKAAKSAQAKAAASEKFVAVLNSRLKEATEANAPLQKMAEEAKQSASESRAKAQQAEGRAQKLQQELAAVTEQRNQLDSARRRLLGEKSRLTKTLAGQEQANKQVYRFLGLLDVGPVEDIPPAAELPGQKPITVKELLGYLGTPTLVFQKGRELSFHWGSEHKADALMGVVTVIDGVPATRAALADVARFRPDRPIRAGTWRFTEGQPLYYADVVEMFDRPDGTGGTGQEFTAWWPVGAWARTATAKVVNGVVTEFDGRPVDPATICELVRHRTQAYRQPNPAGEQAAKKFYDEAGKILAENLQREAVYKARDGWNLQSWQMASFDSVGSWVGPVNAPAGAVAVRAAVQCNWVNDDGRTRSEQRYVVVALTADAEGYRQVEYAVYQPQAASAD